MRKIFDRGRRGWQAAALGRDSPTAARPREGDRRPIAGFYEEVCKILDRALSIPIK